MKIVKNINNNYAIAVDDKGNQVVVSGKGVGFGPVPREIDDLKKINRSFYDVDETYMSMIGLLSEDVIELAGKVIDYARMKINNPISSNVVFTLADHIQFSIERYRKKLNIRLPLLYDVRHLYETEMDVGMYALKLIRERMHVWLPKDEAGYIALHLINAQEKEKNIESINDRAVNDITEIVEESFCMKIDRDDFNYSRFVSHIHYLLKRGRTRKLVESVNDRLYQTIRSDYPETYECSEVISSYLSSQMNITLNDEEKLYLILHINRLCTREDCNR
jgi:beta-glucoside operon transcriptional antiterminator